MAGLGDESVEPLSAALPGPSPRAAPPRRRLGGPRSAVQPIRRRDRPRRPLLERLLARVTSNTTVLDVGAGPGRHTVPLARVARRVTAVEPSDAMRSVLEANVGAADLTNVQIVDGEWPDMPIEPADVVLCSHVVYPVVDIEQFLRGLDAAAREACYLVLRIGQREGAYLPVFEDVWGEPRALAPTAVDLFNVAHQLELPANFETVPFAAWRAYDSIRRRGSPDPRRRAQPDRPGRRGEDSRLPRAAADRARRQAWTLRRLPARGDRLVGETPGELDRGADRSDGAALVLAGGRGGLHLLTATRALFVDCARLAAVLDVVHYVRAANAAAVVVEQALAVGAAVILENHRCPPYYDYSTLAETGQASMAVAEEQFDVTARKFHQWVVVALTVLAFVVGGGFGGIVMVAVGLVMVLGRFLDEADLFRAFYSAFLLPTGRLQPRMRAEDRATRRIARVLGGSIQIAGGVLAAAGAALWLAWGAILLIGLMVALDAALDLCVLCLVVHQFRARTRPWPTASS